ncbi:MAG TPA: murein L,D-transpeptidase, partial [Bradyrhizobium sp.]
MSKRHAVIIAMGLFASASALAQTETTGQAGPKQAAPAGTVPAIANPAHAAAPKAAVATPASTAESRTAAALALTHEPTYDEGTAQRIKDAALSYSDLAVRGGWPAIPADAKFALGVQSAND